MHIVDWLHLVAAILFLGAGAHKLLRKQAEHFFTRFVCFLWFMLTVADRDMPVEFVRILSLNVIMLIPLIEIISPIFRRYWQVKK